MSDTPRTDAAYSIYDLRKVAQDIERELNEANKTNRLQYELITTAEKRGVNKSKEELNAANERIKQLELVINDPHALWANWLRGTVTLPVGIGDVRQYQERIKRLEEVLAWYESKVSDCNRHGPEGNAARDALAKDQGRKAKEAKL